MKGIDLMHKYFGKKPGHKCKDCDHLVLVRKNRRYYKCEVYGIRCSEATDWRVSNDACGLFPNAPYTGNPINIMAAADKNDIQIDGQISLFDPGEVITGGCGDTKTECICRSCMHWWKQDCPYGSCYDDKRAVDNPYIKAHSGEVRKVWSDWDKPGEQDHWCRGGANYPAKICEHYVKYTGQTIEHCLNANIQRFQDGSIVCCLVDTIGCEECYKRFIERQEDNDV